MTTEDKFINRLQNRRPVVYKYKDGELVGQVNIWFHLDKYNCSWEECRDGDQYNEDSYTRDFVREFDSIDDVIEFLRTENLSPTVFGW